MLGTHLFVRTVSDFGAFTDRTNAGRSISNSLAFSSSKFSIQLGFRARKSHGPKSLFISCKASRGSLGGGSTNGEEHDDEYLEAFVLVSVRKFLYAITSLHYLHLCLNSRFSNSKSAETIRHYHLRRQGFIEETKWNSSGQLLRFSIQAKESRADVSSFGHEFLRRFQSPTIFLKIDCDGDLLLPIIVGEFAIEKLIDASKENENGDCPNQFQFVRNLVGKLGYEVQMVRITERVVNTYYARIYFSKVPGEKTILSVDARPSDAINVAKRCKVPIYVNKQIVWTDAIRIVYGTRRGIDAKSTYDVSLDSASEGPDLLAEELDMVRNMNIAIKEERYKDAGEPSLWVFTADFIVVVIKEQAGDQNGRR
ncbi:hypothetical protein HHK36_010380 [Tetracentron sinense]|uniref:BFN domain-containing protein n=1 Tax=Tetracentron sinense TaxID=13715 RepID=A0A834ZCS2_TETSI|nr:hypothetical protein HHK36_010380 [Tetracentron sinense]